MSAEVVTKSAVSQTVEPSRNAVLHSDDRAGGAAAPVAQARRHLRRARQPRRHRRVRRRTRWPVQRRHALSCRGSNWCWTTLQPLLLGSNLRDDNSALTVDLTNPDIYRRAAASCCRRTCCTSCARSSCGAARPISASACSNHGDRAAELRPDAAVRQRFRRSVRGARRTAPAPRHRLAASCSARPTCCSTITGSTARRARTTLHFDPRADAADGQCRDLAARAGAAASRGRCSSRSSCNRPAAQQPAPFFAACSRTGARCARRPRGADQRSRPRTTSSTRCCAARWPTSTC